MAREYEGDDYLGGDDIPLDQDDIDEYFRSLTGGSESEAAGFINNHLGNPDDPGDLDRLFGPQDGGPSVFTNTPGPSGAPAPTPGPTTPGPLPPRPNPNPNPRPTSGGGGDGGGGFSMGPLLQPFPGQFQRPVFGEAFKKLSDLLGPAPEFAPPELPTISPFTPPTAQDIYSDPSFEFRKGIGEKALMNSKAAQGLARTGGTIKDLLDYNQNFASQEFGNIYNRNLGTWKTNADTTLQRAGMDQDRARSIYEPKLFEWTTKGNLGARAEETAYDQAFNEFRTNYDIWRNQGNDVFDRLKWSADFGLDAATR